MSEVAVALPPYGALALIIVVAMAVTPFLNNAATVLIMAQIAATFASSLGYRPDAFLMAVATGSGSDFLTPIGHQCNTLVMGPGGYRCGYYARLGAVAIDPGRLSRGYGASGRVAASVKRPGRYDHLVGEAECQMNEAFG